MVREAEEPQEVFPDLQTRDEDGKWNTGPSRESGKIKVLVHRMDWKWGMKRKRSQGDLPASG